MIINKKMLLFIVSATLGISGCGEKKPSTSLPGAGNEQFIEKQTTVNFDILTDPKFPTLVMPTFMAMDKKDGTLNVENLTQDPVAVQDPLFAMGKTDGWSTTLPIEIHFKGKPLDMNLIPHAFYLIKSEDPTYPSSTTSEELIEGVDYYIKISAHKFEAILLKPLSPSSHYMFAVTDELKNIEGDPVGMSASYAQIKSEKPSSDPAIVSAQAVTQKIENTFENLGVDKSRIIFSTWFTTASVGDVLYGAKLATAWAINNGAETVWKDSGISQGITPEKLAALFILTTPVENTTTLLTHGTVYDGFISLPYYLDIREDKYLSTPWQSAMPSVAIIHNTLTQGAQADKDTLNGQLINFGVTPEDIALAMKNYRVPAQLIKALTGTHLTLANGAPLDPERVITRYNPIPKLKSIQKIGYTLILPKSAQCQADKSNAITLYMHGVTSNMGSLLKSALIEKLMEGSCQAVIAINHPLHGDRGINNKDASSDPTMYLNLDDFTVGRDNIRQSTIDIINLRASLGKLFESMLSSPEILASFGAFARLNPAAPVSYAGHSLGAMTGINVGHVSHRTTGDVQTDNSLFAFEKFALANPGAGIPYMLFNSDTFKPLIKGKILAAQDPDFAALCKGKILPLCYMVYENKLVNDGSPASLERLQNIYAIFNKSAQIAQTVFDTVDPINHSLYLAQTPVYLTQVKGDKIIPNFIPKGAVLKGTDILLPYLPFAGTAPLFKTMSLTPTTQSIQNQTVKSALLFNAGSHSSLLGSMFKPAVTKEMQSQIQSFLHGKGKTLTVTGTSVLDPA